MKKKILIFLCGQIRIFHKGNYNKFLNSFKNYDVKFLILPWSNEKKKIIKIIKKIYKPIDIIKIKKKDFKKKINLIKFPDYAVKTENFFLMWHGITQSIKIIEKSKLVKNWKPDYILKYRFDILPKRNQIFLIPENFKNNCILVPDRYHWNGINDQIFLLNYKNINIFNKFNYYLNIHNLKNNKISKIPLKDLLKIKLIKIKFLIRNFFIFYILKRKRNNMQDIVIKK